VGAADIGEPHLTQLAGHNVLADITLVGFRLWWASGRSL
jgi:hypothetical protein